MVPWGCCFTLLKSSEKRCKEAIQKAWCDFSELRANGNLRGGLVEECLINRRHQNKKKPAQGCVTETVMGDCWRTWTREMT